MVMWYYTFVASPLTVYYFCPGTTWNGKGLSLSHFDNKEAISIKINNIRLWLEISELKFRATPASKAGLPALRTVFIMEFPAVSSAPVAAWASCPHKTRGVGRWPSSVSVVPDIITCAFFTWAGELWSPRDGRAQGPVCPSEGSDPLSAEKYRQQPGTSVGAFGFQNSWHRHTGVIKAN